MASGLKPVFQAKANFTIMLASLANGSARLSTSVSNSTGYYGALINISIMSGATPPTAGALYRVFLIRSVSEVTGSQGGDDDAGLGGAQTGVFSDGGFTIQNAPQLGSILVTATANKVFTGTFDTKPHGPLPNIWGIAVLNSSGQALNATEGNHVKDYSHYNYQAQNV